MQLQLKVIPDELEVLDEDLDEYDLLDTAGGGGGGGGGGSTVGSGAAVVKRADPNCEDLIQSTCDGYFSVQFTIFSVVCYLNVTETNASMGSHGKLVWFNHHDMFEFGVLHPSTAVTSGDSPHIFP